MNIGKVILAIIVAVAAIWYLLSQAKSTTQYIGAAIAIILSLIWIIASSKKKAK